jgi:hypothetical protein
MSALVVSSAALTSYEYEYELLLLWNRIWRAGASRMALTNKIM